eukprot:2355863-Pyramimonas_sp.AAC.1
MFTLESERIFPRGTLATDRRRAFLARLAACAERAPDVRPGGALKEKIQGSRSSSLLAAGSEGKRGTHVVYFRFDICNTYNNVYQH